MENTLLRTVAKLGKKSAKDNVDWCCRLWVYQPKTPKQLLKK